MCLRTRSLAALLWLVGLGAIALTTAADAQSGVRAHYAQGQVWVVWDVTPPVPETFAIYGSDAPITQLSDGELVGRLFAWECFPAAMQGHQGYDPANGWVIPAVSGSMADTLSPSEALFVETVHEAADRYYAVVAWGDSTVTPGDNATLLPVTALYGPGEEVACHLQSRYSTLQGHTSEIYYMWADGRDDPDDSRPDFPVCGNRAKNGMPSLFIVNQRDDSGAEPLPVTYWLHGGGGSAHQSVPGNRPFVDIDPEGGLVVAHNDDFVRHVQILGLQQGESNSWWFGWPANHDPFDPGGWVPESGDVVINYTQRRLLWIHNWLVREGRVDPDFASVQGHSVGAAGTTALAKAFPHLFATASVFMNGFEGPDAGSTNGLFGEPGDSLRCNLSGPDGTPVVVLDAFDLNTAISGRRDLPLMRIWHGKNDDNGTMRWDANVVEEYERADSLGWGMHLYWDERGHGLDTGGHWAEDDQQNQTERDNAAYQHAYRVAQSYPAFYNHRVQPGAFWPGDGTGGSGGQGVGDDWGTWGGFHDWDLDTLVDTPAQWEASLFLISGSAWIPDNCSCDSLVSDFTVRKPQRFRPEPGELVDWWQVAAGPDTIRSGTVTVDEDGLVRVPGLTVYEDPMRTRLVLRLRGVSDVAGEGAPFRFGSASLLGPNPFFHETSIRLSLPRSGDTRIEVFDVAGRSQRTLVSERLGPGSHEIRWDGLDSSGRPVNSGVYFIRFRGPDLDATLRITRIR